MEPRTEAALPEEALGGYVGDLGRVRSNIDLACRIVRSAQTDAV